MTKIFPEPSENLAFLEENGSSVRQSNNTQEHQFEQEHEMDVYDECLDDTFEGVFVSHCAAEKVACYVLGDLDNMQTLNSEQHHSLLLSDRTLTESALRHHCFSSRNNTTWSNDDESECTSERGDERETFGSSISDTSASQASESESVTDEEEILSAEQLLGEDFEREAVNNGTD